MDYRRFSLNKMGDKLIKAIDAKLKTKNLKGMPSTNLQNPADDIKNKEVRILITKEDTIELLRFYVKAIF